MNETGRYTVGNVLLPSAKDGAVMVEHCLLLDTTTGRCWVLSSPETYPWETRWRLLCDVPPAFDDDLPQQIGSKPDTPRWVS